MRDSKRLGGALRGAARRIESAAQKQLPQAGRVIKQLASQRHQYVSRTGTLERRGIVVQTRKGAVEIALSEQVPYAQYVHEGTRSHVISAINGQVLRFTSRGRVIFARRVRHPGSRPDPFLYEAAEAAESDVHECFSDAIGKAIEQS